MALLSNLIFQSHIFKIVFQSNIALTMSFKTLLLTVIPKRYYCQKQCFSKIYQNGITFETNVFKLIFQNGFSMYYQRNDVCQNTASDSNTKTVLLPEAVFYTEIPNWYYLFKLLIHLRLGV